MTNTTVTVGNGLKGAGKRKEIKEAREELRQWLVHYTQCSIQDGWPCGTCAIHFLKQLGVKESHQHNKPVDRLNEAWRAILQIRGEKA